ncbi:MAG: DNA topoisomerase (ATP-hydrolyzing) subunit B [Oscillospiraceae bacterium]|nr:DNA topoisomerase (ATP-hydrolyzing) subunit B [Oscillospiraceae bacterium]
MADNENLTEVTEVNYGADEIKVLKGLDPVRKRPGMYIGSTGESGLHHLVYEIVDNAIDEALAGFCTEIDVSILPDNVIRVIDNGRGVPTGINHSEGISAATLVFTVLHAGGKFDNDVYKVSGGLHGVGASVVNALSEWLEVEIHDGENVHFQRFDKGEYSELIKVIGKTDRTGTTVTFKPDGEIFHTTVFSYETLQDRMREEAFLNAGLKIKLHDLRDENNVKNDEFCYEGGICSYIEWLNKKRDAEVLHPDIIYLKGTANDVQIEAAFQYTTDFNSEIFRSFANNIHTGEGGMHELGFKRALNKVINDYTKQYKETNEKNKVKKKAAKKGEEEKAFTPISGEAIREAINAIISVKCHECEFEGQTKGKLGNPEVQPAVYKVITEQLTYYFEEHPETAQIIMNKAINSQAARDAAKRAMEAKRKSIMDSNGLPGKLADCSDSDPTHTEIYIVEGDSAGGSAKEGRDRRFQAILSLWGKMLNVEKARADKVYNNDKLLPVVKALGTGIAEDFDLSKLRYGRVIIMADADVDGLHIRTLMLTFFFRFMRPLLENGHVYIAQPPLFKISKGKQVRYAFSDEERDAYISELGGGENSKIDVQRYKGLGEMDPSQLWETTMNPETRTMLRVSVEDAAKADEIMTILMGDKVEPRRRFIEQNAKLAENLDV